MRIFIAGATGTLGRPLATALAALGHEVWGLTRSAAKRPMLDGIGVRPIVANALDPAGLQHAVVTAAPELVIHLLTAIPPAGVLRPSHLRPTNTLRIHGTANLIRAAVAAGTRRIIAESFIGVYGTPTEDRLWTESDLLPPIQRGPMAEAVRAMRSLEEQMAVARCSGALDTVTLRFGLF